MIFNYRTAAALPEPLPPPPYRHRQCPGLSVAAIFALAAASLVSPAAAQPLRRGSAPVTPLLNDLVEADGNEDEGAVPRFGGKDEAFDKISPQEFNGDSLSWGSNPNSVCRGGTTHGGNRARDFEEEPGTEESVAKLDGEFIRDSEWWSSTGGGGVSICGIGATQYVKVSLSGRGKVLSLAEVQVLAMVDGSEKNVALVVEGASATQSSTCNDDNGGDFNANKAIDGITEGNLGNVTHTTEERNPWWEVQLSESHDVTKVVVWNQRENYGWLTQATVTLLDDSRQVQATFQLPKEPEKGGEGTKGPSFAFVLPQSCALVEGTYSAEKIRPWWAFKPARCPPKGCPLFFWIDGTGEVDFREERQQQWMTEMFNRGYVSATVDYASNIADFGGCHGTPFNDKLGVVDKAKQMFDQENPDSVINQLCNKAYVNCDGIAVAGFSQGSQIAALASDFDDRVSAALLYGSGDEVDKVVVNPRQHCMDTIKLPKQRRRYLSGDNDNLFFNGDYDRGRLQLIRMSHYDNCTAREAVNSPDDCLEHQPPSTTDPYTGGTIDNTGGYYIVPNGAHGQFMDWSNFTGTVVDFNKNMHLDWLDRTARMTKPPLAQEQLDITLTLDSGNVRGTRVEHGFFFEWAANVNGSGVLGKRHVVVRNKLDDRVDFPRVPRDMIGFRVSARTHDAGRLVHLEAKTSDGIIFKNLSFEAAFCFSVVPERDWDDCVQGKSLLCVDFCTDGNWYDCTKSFTVPGGSDEESEEFSKCLFPAEHDDKTTFNMARIEVNQEIE